MNIEKMLDQLAEYEAERDAIALRKQEAIDAVLTPEIKAALAEIDAEFDPLNAPVNENIDGVTAAIKLSVIEHGATVKGQYRQAVYSGGRISWDTKALDGYAAAHPEIAPFRKVGEPSVSIRIVK
jgi:capsule polysaccharide export protein KpsE/RkpR